MPSWEIALYDKVSGNKLTIKTDGTEVEEDREYVLPGTGGNLLTEEHLADPANFPTEFKEAIRGATGDGITSIVFLSTTDVSGLRGKPGATDTYQITLSNSEKSEFVVTNGLPNAELSQLIQDAIEGVIGAAPAALDTLAEIAAAINNNSDFYNSIIQAISLKADSSTVYNKTQVDDFVTTLKIVPQISKSVAYTLALSDSGAGIDTTANVTIPLASSVNFLSGTTIVVTNVSNASITVSAAAGVVLRQAGTTLTGNKTIPAYSMVTLRKVNTDTWFVSDVICMYNKSEIDAFIAALTTAVNTKANSTDVYIKSQIDTLLAGKAAADASYTKAQVDAALLLKATQASTYTKTEIDATISSMNIAIASKPNSANVYTKTEIDNALAGKLATSQKGAINGLATLGADGKVPSSQLPSYVDDVLEYTNLAGFPATGEASKIFVDLATNITYRWSGTTYTEISSGAVSSVSGKTGAITLVKGDVGLGNVDNTSDASKPVSAAQLAALNLKANATNVYTKAESDATAAVLKTMPQVLKSVAYTLTLADSGNSIDTTNTVTIPTEATVAFVVGTVIRVTNIGSGNVALTPATGVNLRFNGITSQAVRSLPAYTAAEIRKTGSNIWAFEIKSTNVEYVSTAAPTGSVGLDGDTYYTY